MQHGFNRPNTVLSQVELIRLKNVNLPMLSVGARALCKHAHRSSEGYWGEPRGTEQVKN